MVKGLIHRITATFMALLMLLSSTGFSMDVHYCQDQLKGVSLIGKAKTCHDKPDSPACHKAKKSCDHKNGTSKVDEKNCCHNESIVIEKSVDEATNAQIAALTDLNLDFAAAFVAVYIYSFHIESDYQSFEDYKPPLPDRDFQLIYQTFLI